jgi:post-segregation antitoxin (ccd killing protein)
VAMLAAEKRTLRKNFFLPADLAGRAESVARNLGVDFSQLTRQAIREFVERAEKESMDRELAEACDSYRQFNKKFSAEWAHFETRSE